MSGGLERPPSGAAQALLALLAGGRPVLFDGRLLDRGDGVDHVGVGDIGVLELLRFAPDCRAAGFGHVFLLESLTAWAGTSPKSKYTKKLV